MVTSAVPREGKTFTAFNLALSISGERDIEVVLIDADPHRGQLLDMLGLEKRPGLLEYLAGEVRSLSSVLLPTERDNLWVLPPGSPHEHHSELLAGARMAALIGELDLVRRPRIVLFDTPPLLASTESVMLASHVGQIVVVVEAAKTSRRVLEQALAMVSACPEVNLLLNKADALRQYERYGEYQIAS
jgi:Mrp family chromosome partitioning ATPase